MSTLGMLKQANSEATAAVGVYTNYFGPLSFNHVALTQQTACNYGQSWPMLVYLPICYFFDNTIKHNLGLLDRDAAYWNTVAAHEVAHQWWGQTVGFSGYRDQWMSEGFADFSASLFLLYTNPKMDEFRNFWKQQQDTLVKKNEQGKRPVDLGPVTMGWRVSSDRTGAWAYQQLIYPKGAYILHMLEMMYWTPQYKEEPFQKAMQAFVAEYRGRAASTEDFKASLEKNLPGWVDVTQNKKLDWFFDDYVYGTETPTYSIKSDFTTQDDVTKAHLVLTQAGVSDSFLMLVPIYIEFEDKTVFRIMSTPLKGTVTVDRMLSLGKLPKKPRRLLLNYNYDVLSTEN